MVLKGGGGADFRISEVSFITTLLRLSQQLPAKLGRCYTFPFLFAIYLFTLKPSYGDRKPLCLGF